MSADDIERVPFDQLYVRMENDRGAPGCIGMHFSMDADGHDADDFEAYFEIEIDEGSWGQNNQASDFHSVSAIDIFLRAAKTPEDAEIVADWLEDFASRVRSKFREIG